MKEVSALPYLIVEADPQASDMTLEDLTNCVPYLSNSFPIPMQMDQRLSRKD
jgi:hypothetical protein